MRNIVLLALLFVFLCFFPSCESGDSSGNQLQYDQQFAQNSVTGYEDRDENKRFIDLLKIYGYTYNDDVAVRSSYDDEEITIDGNVYIPCAKKEGELFPLIIFINSWGCDEYEYKTQAKIFARKGYIVLSYECRGWGDSGGYIRMGGEEDWTDFSAVLDWAEQNTPVDMSNVGVCGISLGGGGSLHAVSHDSRVKTVCALSSYIDAFKSMFSDETPRKAWGEKLADSGVKKGNMPDEILNVLESTFTNTNIDWVKEWAEPRSPITHVNDVNAANKPVYMGHNFADYMFQPNTAIEYFNSLTVNHKRLDLSSGTHATGEGSGLAGLPNYTFSNVHKWFDYWLRGIRNDIISDSDSSAKVTVQVKNTGKREVYSKNDLSAAEGKSFWPPQQQKEKTFYFGKRGLFSDGKLLNEPECSAGRNTVFSGGTLGATIGIIPIVSQALEPYLPVYSKVYLLNRFKSILFESEILPEKMKIRGNVKMNIDLSLSKEKGQVIFYLYDINDNGTGQFITHAFKTFWNAVPGEVMNVDLDFVSVAYDLPKGHRLGLVMDTSEGDYGKPTEEKYKVRINYSEEIETQSFLTIPFVY